MPEAKMVADHLNHETYLLTTFSFERLEVEVRPNYRGRLHKYRQFKGCAFLYPLFTLVLFSEAYETVKAFIKIHSCDYYFKFWGIIAFLFI